TYTGAYAVTDTAQISLTSNQAAINSIALLATNGGIDISTSGVGGLGELRLRAGGSLKLDTSGNNNNILVDSGTGDLLANVGTTTLTTQDDVIAAIALRSSRGGIQLSSSNASGNGDIRVLSAGTLQLDTSVTNSNILARTGTGRIDLASGGTGTGSTAAITLAATNGGIDLSTSGVNGNGNLSLRSAGTLTLDTTASDTDINVLAGNNTSTSLTLRSDRGGIDLSSSSANGSGDIKLRSAGTLHLDTSVNSANILANTGAGRFVVTAGGTGTSTTAAIALAATNGGIDLSTSGVNGNGNLSLRSAGTLQLDTSLNNSDLLVRTGTGTVDISSGRFTLTGQNDNVSAIRLYADRGGIDISTGNASGNGNFTVRSAGTLRLDTSATNAAIMLRSGTGRIDLSGNTILVNSGAGTLDLSSNSTIKIVSATTASLWGETGTTIGRAGQVTTAYGRLCIQGSDGGAACPAGSDGRLFVQVTGEVSDDPGDVFDLAEYYPASEAVDPGTVVVADSNSRATVKMSRYAYQRVLGVVSTTPAIRINEGSFEVGGSAITNASVKPLIALVGRVPVKVSNENGTIRVGDRLVASTKAGYAMKATKQGMTLGMALEDASFENGAVEAKVMTFVNVSWYFPEVVEELEKEYQTAQVLGTQPSATAALTAATAVAVSPASQDDPSIPSDSSISDAVAGAATEAANITVTVAAPPTEFPNLAVTKALTVGKELKVAGKATFEGEVEVVADATFGKNVIIVGNLRIGGNLEVAGAVVTNLIAGASIAAGDPVAIGADGKAYRAGADKAVIGVAAGNAAAEELVKVAVAGKVGNMAGLTTGYRYFVNEAGTLTTDGQGGQGLGVAVSATEMLVQPGVGLPAAAAPVKEEPVKESVKEETKPIVPVDQPVILPVQSPTLTTTQVQEQPLVPQVGELKFQTTLE
ncbi:hypothetical protein HYU89_00155, partial [Candidatus Collierbacteria bacterium]|nr:hypothetical protein [Candidatus Collierbacteria bacterium]